MLNNKAIESKIDEAINTIADYSSSPFSLVAGFDSQKIEEMKQHFHQKMTEYMKQFKELCILYGERKQKEKQELNTY